LDVPTRSSDTPRAGNAPAIASVVVGLASVAGVPAGVALSWYSERVDLVPATGGGAVTAFVLGVAALACSRHGAARIQWTLGRSGGGRAVRAGRVLGLLGICVAITAGLALAFHAVLELMKD
jgi:hypothetical protein